MNSTYVGIFLEMETTTRKTQKEILVNSKGQIFTEGKYDPNTGERLTSNNVSLKVVVIPDAVITDKDNIYSEEFSRIFLDIIGSDNERILFILNTANDKYCRYLKGSEIHNIEGTLKPENLIESFKSDFKTHLKHYDKQGYKYTIRYGVINTSNI
jgi:hypothetical protein